MIIGTSQKGAVTTLELALDVGQTQYIWVTSDVHVDSVYSNRKLFLSDLDEASKREAAIVINGDLVDAMQGRFDPRRDMSMLRPEYRRADYYDFVVYDIAGLLSPYAKWMKLISPGNHELAVLKNANTYLSDRIVRELNKEGGDVQHGGYGGWIRALIKDGTGAGGSAIKIKYFHGAGGEAPVTRGAIQTNRQAVYLPDADVVINGHSHNSYHIPITRERLGNKGDQYFDTQHHVRTPGYMQSYGDGTVGWEVTRGGVPKPLGGAFIKITATSGRQSKRPIVAVEPIIHSPSPLSPTNDIFQGTVYPQE